MVQPIQYRKLLNQRLGAWKRKRDYNSQKSFKIFKATIFSQRNGVSQKATPGWVINDVEDIDWLGEIFEKKTDIHDL